MPAASGPRRGSLAQNRQVRPGARAPVRADAAPRPDLQLRAAIGGRGGADVGSADTHLTRAAASNGGLASTEARYDATAAPGRPRGMEAGEVNGLKGPADDLRGDEVAVSVARSGAPSDQSVATAIGGGMLLSSWRMDMTLRRAGLERFPCSGVIAACSLPQHVVVALVLLGGVNLAH